jgi:transcription initiation factor TFIIB
MDYLFHFNKLNDYIDKHDKKVSETKTDSFCKSCNSESIIWDYKYSSKYRSLIRIQNWNKMPSDERSLYEVFKHIDTLNKNYYISSKIINETKHYYKKISEKDENITGFLTRGNIRKSLIAACLFIACKNNNKPMREKEIADICNLNKSDVTRGIKKFSELEKNKNIKINNVNNSIHYFINKYSKILNFESHIIKMTHLLYIRSKKLKLLNNNNNESICAGLLYFVSQYFHVNLKKKSIIEILNISEVTINKIHKEFNNNKDILTLGFEHIHNK